MAAAHEVSFEFVFPTIGYFTSFTIAKLEFLNGIEATPGLLSPKFSANSFWKTGPKYSCF